MRAGLGWDRFSGSVPVPALGVSRTGREEKAPCSVLGPSLQGRCWGAGVSPEKSNGSGAQGS